MGLRRRQDSGDDDGAGMDRGALEGVVVILAMGGGPVDQRGARHVQAAGLADGGDAAAFACAENRLHVIQTPRPQAQPGHVEQRLRRLFTDRAGDIIGVECGGPGGELFGDGATRRRQAGVAHGR